MSLGQRFSCAVVLLLSIGAHAGAPKHQDLTAAEKALIILNQQTVNMQLMQAPLAVATPARPFSEMDVAGYLFMSAGDDFDSQSAKEIMAKNLPAGTDLVIFTDPGSDKSSLQSRFSGLIAPDRLHIVELNGSSNGFWARDGLPVPALNLSGGLDLVDAKYYYPFEPDKVMAKWFHAGLIQHKYYFEGGNFMVNDIGDCISILNDQATEIPDSAFTTYYGCKKVIRLPFVKGIGHADESVKFIGSKIVLTDTPQYVQVLQQNGYEVRMLPRPARSYETYVNSLLVNGTVYVPIFNESNDQTALNVYKAAGLNVVGIPTEELSNDGLGSLHCITMTYPKVPFQDLLRALGGREL